MIVFELLFVLTIVCAFVTISSNYHWGLKSLLIACILFSSLGSFVLLKRFEGHPSAISALPAEIVIYGQAIDLNNDKIYLLYSSLDKNVPEKYVILDYDPKLHEALEEGREKFEGKEFVLTSEKDGEGGEGGDKESTGEGKKGSEKGSGKQGQGNSLSKGDSEFGVRRRFPHKMPEK